MRKLLAGRGWRKHGAPAHQQHHSVGQQQPAACTAAEDAQQHSSKHEHRSARVVHVKRPGSVMLPVPRLLIGGSHGASHREKQGQQP